MLTKKIQSFHWSTKLFQNLHFNLEEEFLIEFSNMKTEFEFTVTDENQLIKSYSVPFRRVLTKIYRGKAFPFLLPLSLFNKSDFDYSSNQLDYMLKHVRPEEVEFFAGAIVSACTAAGTTKYFNRCTGLISTSSKDNSTLSVPIDVFLVKIEQDSNSPTYLLLIFRANPTTKKMEYWTQVYLSNFNIDSFKESGRVALIIFNN